VIRLLPKTEVGFPKGVSITVGLSADVEIQYTGVTAALKDESGSLHLQKSNGNFVEIRSYIYFEVHNGADDE
jgi:hypothetical protein